VVTLADCYLLYDKKPVSWAINIGGVDLTEFVSVTYTFGLQKVPTASIRIRGAVPASCIFGARVTIDLGFWGWQQRVFTGSVLHPDNSDTTGKIIECQGISACLDNAYHKVIITVDGSRTVPQLIGDLLAASGAPDYSVNMPTWTAGAVVPQTLSFQTYGEAITKLAEVNGGRWYETPTGVIKVEPKDPIPAVTPWRTYFSMVLTGTTEAYPAGLTTGRPRLRKCGQVRKARDVKNQCWVRGAVLTNNNPDGSQTSVTLEERAYAPSPWVLNPDGSQAYNDELYSNEIIDVVAVAGAEAGRRVSVKNRLLTQVAVAVDGDPQVQAGVTVGIEDPNYSAVSGLWFVESISTTLQAGKLETTLSLLGGPKAGGEINVAPFANFTYALEHEIMGDRPWLIATFDASPSIDPDGTIVSWCWTDNQGTPLITGCGQVVTVRVDPATIVAPWEVTLTVTDNDGGTDDLVLSIPFTSSAPTAYIPSLFCAFDTAASATPDGGITWNDQAIAGKSVISTAAKPSDGITFGVGVFGTTDGLIYRTTDFCATAPTLVCTTLGGQPIEHLWWDINVQTRVWAITRNGLLYWSQDDGLTWALYDDLAALFGLGSIRLARIGTPVAGGVWVFGGTGTGWPGIWWDYPVGAHNWTGADLTGGELETDLIASGFPTDLYVAHAASHGDALCIVLNSATHTPPVYTSASGGLGDGTDWKRALGDAGALAKTRGKWIDLDLTVGHYALGFDDNAIYTMDVAAGVGTIAAAVATFGTDKGNYAVSLAWYENFDQAYLVATEFMTGTAAGTIYKTWDRFGTVAKVRPATGFAAAPAGGKAKMIALGAPQTPFIQAKLLIAGRLITPDEHFQAWRTPNTSWTNRIVAEGVVNSSARFRVKPLTSLFWLVIRREYDNPGFGSIHESLVERTKTAGAAWDMLANPAGNYRWVDFALDAGGRLWGLAYDGDTLHSGVAGCMQVLYSDDLADTWTLSAEYHAHTVPNTSHKATALMCHPSDQNKIAVLVQTGINANGHWQIMWTVDRGAVWNFSGNEEDLGYSNLAYASRPLLLPSGRILAISVDSPVARVMKTDDWGEVWSLSYAGTGGYPTWIWMLGFASSFLGDKIFFCPNSFLSTGAEFMDIQWSRDQANSWELLSTPSLLAAAYGLGGMAYSDVEDALYIISQGQETTNVRQVMKMSPVVAGGPWIDVTDTLVPIGAHPKFVGYHGQNIGVIPW